MNVLFIHEVDWLTKVVFDIHTLAEALSLRGHRVYALDYENSWKRKNLFDLGTLKTRTLNDISRALPGSKVTLIRPGFIKISGISRITAAVTSYFEIRRTIKKYKIDAIVLYSVPTTGLQTINAAKKYRIPVIFRAIDVLNRLVTSPELRPATRTLEKKVYPRADLVLSLSPALSRYVEQLGAKKENIKELLVPVDTDVFRPLPPPQELLQKWGLKPEDKVVLFIGTLFDFSGLDTVIPKFVNVLKEIPEARLLIVGDGPQRPKLEGIIKENGVGGKVTITGFQPYDTMPQHIALAEVCFNSFLLTGATRDIFPGKLVQYLACGKPVISTPLPGVLAITPGEEQGMVFAADAEEITAKMIMLLKDKVYRERLGKNGLAYAVKFHSLKAVTDQLETTLREAIYKKKHG
jgi:glycosyltransferase involved in cell wall biosynthesis